MNHKGNKNYRNTTARRIDIDAIYNALRAAIKNRNRWQEEQRKLWSIIKKTKANHKNEMDAIGRHIGEETHKINCLISQLCQYKRTHKAMNLAYEYLKREIERLNEIIKRRREYAELVRAGKAYYQLDDGTMSTNPNTDREYINQKMAQRSKLQNWLNYVSRYLVK